MVCGYSTLTWINMYSAVAVRYLPSIPQHIQFSASAPHVFLRVAEMLLNPHADFRVGHSWLRVYGFKDMGSTPCEVFYSLFPVNLSIHFLMRARYFESGD